MEPPARYSPVCRESWSYNDGDFSPLVISQSAITTFTAQLKMSPLLPLTFLTLLSVKCYHQIKNNEVLKNTL